MSVDAGKNKPIYDRVRRTLGGTAATDLSEGRGIRAVDLARDGIILNDSIE